MRKEQPRKGEVTVLGAGVVGLTTAAVLRQRGVDVRVVADRVGPDTSSVVAGAVWFPFKVDVRRRSARWARDGYRWLRRASSNPATGVLPALPFHLLEREEPQGHARPDWARAIPPGVRVEWVPLEELAAPARDRAIRAGCAGAWRFPAPLVDPPRHMEWLLTRVGRVERVAEPLGSLSDLKGGVVVNCTGRRARALTGDVALEPRLGQIVVARDAGLPRSSGFVDATSASALVYSIPRGGSVVLGGFDSDQDDGPAAWTQPDPPGPDPAIERRILGRLAEQGLVASDTSSLAEWRPIREVDGVNAVRLEREGSVIHNYGHGGSGYTLAYGCAREVARILARSAW